MRVCLGLALCVCLPLAACRMAQREGFHLNVTDFDAQDESLYVDDVLVWPVQQNGTSLSPELLQRLTRRLHLGVRDQQYSVLSRSLVEHLATEHGGAETGALAALEKTQADGVLVVEITNWDERGLLTLGKIRAEGTLKLLGPGGRVRWQGKLDCDAALVSRQSGPRDIDERREVAVERFAELVAARLPAHRV